MDKPESRENFQIIARKSNLSHNQQKMEVNISVNNAIFIDLQICHSIVLLG